MPATWYPFGISPTTEPVLVRDKSVEGVKGDRPPLPPIRLVLTPPKVKKAKAAAKTEKPIAA